MSKVTNKLLGDEASPYVPALKRFEGHIPKARRLKFFNKKTKKWETEKHPTIGYGDYGSHVNVGDKQKPEDSLTFLKKNITVRLPEIKRAIPNFDSLSDKQKEAIVVGWFRGSIKPKHKTVALIKKGKFREASEEFLNHDDYKNAKDTDKSGLIERMEYVSAGIAGGTPSAASTLIGPKEKIRPLKKGEFIQNPGGSKSTERLIGIDDPRLNNGKPTLIPSVFFNNGKIVQFSSVSKTGDISISHEQQAGAIDAAVASGLEFPSFDTHEQSTEFAKERSRTGGIQNGPLGKKPKTLGTMLDE